MRNNFRYFNYKFYFSAIIYSNLMKINFIKIFFALALVFNYSCQRTEIGPAKENSANTPNQHRVAATLSEGFETGTKTAYAAADVTLGTGIWNLNDALIGNSTSDRKSGTQSARVVNSGKLTMKFDKAGGA